MQLRIANEEVTQEDAVKGDKLSNGLVGNAVMLLRGVIRTIKCHVESCTHDLTVTRKSMGRGGRTASERLHGKKPTQECVPFEREREGAGETNIFETVEQNESQKKVRSVSGSEKQQCRVLCGDGRRCVQSEVRRTEQNDRWDKEAINNVIGLPWRIVDGKWTVNRPVTQIDP